MAQLQLTDKVALITGAQQGIGHATALAFARAGAHVVVNYLDDATAAENLQQTLHDLGVQAVTVQADIAVSADQQRLIDAAASLGGIDILVNNAAIFPRVPFLEMTEADWDEVITINLKGSTFCTQAIAKQMVQQGRGGSIINFSSGAAFRSSPRGVHYVASKAGVIGMTRAAALELAPYKIRVNAIAPGLTDTAQPRYGMTEQELSDAGDLIPFGLTQPEEVAELAVFLASDAASKITGQTIHVNGGQYLY